MRALGQAKLSFCLLCRMEVQVEVNLNFTEMKLHLFYKLLVDYHYYVGVFQYYAVYFCSDNTIPILTVWTQTYLMKGHTHSKALRIVFDEQFIWQLRVDSSSYF